MKTIRHTVIAFTVLAALALGPVAANTFTVHLTNGATFETRYQPRVAVGDGSKVVVVTDVPVNFHLQCWNGHKGKLPPKLQLVTDVPVILEAAFHPKETIQHVHEMIYQSLDISLTREAFYLYVR